MNVDAADISIHIENARLQYHQAAISTLQDCTLHIPARQWTCLLGRSGSGKTTLLRYLAGLLTDQVSWQGVLSISDGQPLNGRIAYMAQQDLLLPWLSVADNVCLSHRLSGQTITPDIRQQAEHLLEQVGLADQRQSLPQTLSGGMRQRVALARTLMQDKPLVLMDEPFSALDAVTRHKLQSLSFELLKDKTVVLITHDPQEAVRLADALYILSGSPAQAQAIALPEDLPPRVLSAATAQIQQHIFQVLGQDYD